MNQNYFQGHVHRNLYFITFQKGRVQHPLGSLNPLETMDFTDPRIELSPIAPPLSERLRLISFKLFYLQVTYLINMYLHHFRTIIAYIYN